MQESIIYRSIQEEAEARGKAIGEARMQRKIALNCLRDGLPLEIVADATGLSLEEVQQLQQQIDESSQS